MELDATKSTCSDSAKGSLRLSRVQRRLKESGKNERIADDSPIDDEQITSTKRPEL